MIHTVARKAKVDIAFDVRDGGPEAHNNIALADIAP